jgi:serine/threonine-protein kinase RsbW
MPATSGPDSNAYVTPQELVPGLRWRRVFAGDERQLSVLRRWLEYLLPPCPARHDVTAVVSELGANAIKHTASGRGGWFAVEVTWLGPVVRVAVADSGGPAEPHVIDEPAGEHGRGLLLVRGLAARTGWCGDQRGRLIWADVPWNDAATAARPDAYEAAIRDGESALARRFAGIPGWFGRATLAWWALTGPSGLVTAPTARELAALLYRLLNATPPPATRPAQAPRDASPGTHQDQRWCDARPGPASGDHLGPGSATAHQSGSRYRPGRPGMSHGPASAVAGRQHPALFPALTASGASPSRSLRLPSVSGLADCTHSRSI